MKKIKLILISKLKPHEEIIPENLEKVKNKIRKNGYLINPVIVDQKNLVILDGHHRVRALELLGYKKIPAYLVDYYAKEIKVLQRRPEIPISKKIIVEKALNGGVFPCKTTKHLIPKRPMRLNIPLENLE
ncbi:MAG: ParB N-terminal domain-containing protein [Candidatus Moranbacteria bacterium]|nr:ParB N-terminal domain-containing protein [Candidatus Moranbacteria bacterium]